MENFCLFLSGQDNWLAEKLIPICVFVYRDTKSLDVLYLQRWVGSTRTMFKMKIKFIFICMGRFEHER